MLYRKNYIFYVMYLWVCLAACRDNGPASRTIPDLRESFSKTDKRPFGAYIAYHEVEELFYRNTIHDERKLFDNGGLDFADTGCISICITPVLSATRETVDNVLEFVERGNDAFFSAANFDENLQHMLGFSTSYSDAPYYSLTGQLTSTSTTVKEGDVMPLTGYSYFYHPFLLRFNDMDSTTTRVLGVNDKGDPNYIVIFHGKGRLFLHCEPRALSNYFLLQKDNYEYLQKAFSYLRPGPDKVYWVDRLYASSSGNGSFDSLRELLSHGGLAAAFWLSVALLVIFILFGGKRRQRIVPPRKPNVNTTLAFTETIGGLYLQKKDNANIADKMATYFNEFIRNNYFLNTNLVNEEFVTTLSRKSGVQREAVESLYRALQHVQRGGNIDDYQLLSLHTQIQNFYKNRN